MKEEEKMIVQEEMAPLHQDSQKYVKFQWKQKL